MSSSKGNTMPKSMPPRGKSVKGAHWLIKIRTIEEVKAHLNFEPLEE
jgi:hypothetical protein